MEEINLSVIIVEDDYSYAIELERLCSSIGYRVVGNATSSAEALDLIYSANPDVILMDIKIPGHLNGVELGHAIRPLKIPILYLTAYDKEEYRSATEESQSIGYVVKPVTATSLATILEMIVYRVYFGQAGENAVVSATRNKENILFFKKDREYQRVAVSDIAYVSSEGNYCNVCLRSEKCYLLRTTFAELRNHLNERDFITIHRSHIVRGSMIEAIDTQSQYLRILGKPLPISRSRMTELRTKFSFLS